MYNLAGRFIEDYDLFIFVEDVQWEVLWNESTRLGGLRLNLYFLPHI
jgi:hypothetical protein